MERVLTDREDLPVTQNTPVKLNVLFRGLNLFHFRENGAYSDCQVLMVNALSPDDDDRKHHLVEHTPWLHFQPSLVSDLDALSKEEQDGCVPLNSLTVRFDAPEGPTTVPKRKIPYGGMPGKDWGDESGLQWVASLNDILRDERPPAKLDPRCLNDPPSPKNRVISKVMLNGGRLESSRVGKYLTAPVGWDFRRSPAANSMWNQAMTEWVTWTVDGFDEFVGISLIDEHGDQRTIALKPPKNEDTVHILIENSPTETSNEADPLHLHHFRWYYKLLENPPSKEPIPMCVNPPNLVVASAPCGNYHMLSPVGNAFCPPTGWNG